MNDNVKDFAKEIEANEELAAKIEALEGSDDAVERIVAIAAEYGYALTEEELTESEDADLDLDDLESVAGGIIRRKRIIVVNRLITHRDIIIKE